MKILLADEEMELLPQKAIFWERTKTLLLADCHFGKVAHFRRSGIGIPTSAGHETFLILHQLIKQKSPERILFLGDLFHSQYNSDFEKFSGWRKQFSDIEFTLVLGNHDIEALSLYEQMGLRQSPNLIEGRFYFTHEPDKSQPTLFNLAGHIHPGIGLSGTARQHVKVPCFWFGENFGVLPAFGQFTGSHPIHPTENDQVYAVAGSRIFDLKGVASFT